jgi:SAM-dependent methyltransferase
MHTDVADLRDFYTRPLGVVTRRLLRARIRARWENVRGDVVMGLGFATPYLSPFRDEAAVVGALMPAGQGVLAWPSPGPYRSVLVDEDALPLSDSSVDRLLVVHCLEVAEHVRPLLDEIWRVLRPEGHLLMIVPNRRGPWSRLDTTPFGQGRPYSRGQLERLLAGARFSAQGWSAALYMPPFERRLLLRYATSFERAGRRFWPAFAGVILVEARKELIAPIGRAERLKPLRDLRPFRTAPAAGFGRPKDDSAAA